MSCGACFSSLFIVVVRCKKYRWSVFTSRHHLFDNGKALFEIISRKDTSSATYLFGSSITVTGSTTFTSSVTFNTNINVQNTLTIADGYGIRLTDTQGNVTYAFYINTSDQIALTNTKLDLYVYGKVTYIGWSSSTLYLRGTIAANAVFANGLGIKINNSSGTAQTVLYMSTGNQICMVNANHDVCVYGKRTYLGSPSYPTIIRGLTVTVDDHMVETMYKAGDSINTYAFVYGWFNNSTTMTLFFPLARGISAGTTVICTAATSAYIRTVRGSYASGANSTLTSYITDTTIRTGGLQVTFVKPEGWGESVATPVAGTISLQFSMTET